MDELVEWLRTQLDADEAGHDWPHRPSCQMLKPVPPGFPFDCFSCNCGIPGRWLREVEAKRQILRAWPDPMGQWSADQAVAGRAVKERVLRLLALPYADRPGYQEDWRP